MSSNIFAGPKVLPDSRGDNDERPAALNPTPTSFEAPLRPKRQQVARACDLCRMHRRKCDNDVPCKNCASRGEQCINKSPGERRTLPQAYREIDRLKQKVKELEDELEKERMKPSSAAPSQPGVLTPPDTTDSATPAASVAETVSLSHHHVAGGKQPVWGGVMTSTGQSSQKTWCGPSSLFYYINRMNTYLSAVFQQLHPHDLIQLKSVSKTFATPDYNPPDDADKSDTKGCNQPVSNEAYLTPIQEEYFLSLYWQSYHPTFPILDESGFRKHYRSLTTIPGKPRKPSALVDIVIAVSMQVGMAMAQRNSQRPLSATEVGKDDPSIAGRMYYRRCQRLLYNEQEAPTLMTVQCHLLSAVYTCCAAFPNMCHVALSVAMRSAHMLGLHIDPPSDLPQATQELRKRVWWTLATLESKMCMKLGRPFYSNAQSACGLPAHDHLAASLAGSDFALIDENTSWLTFTFYNVKLVLAAREVHTNFFESYSDFYTGSIGQVIYDDPEALERYAKFLITAMRPLDDWTKTVPETLKLKRRGGGQPLSTDRTPIDMEGQFVPPWLQLQRLMLELLYHVQRINLYRPFICFPSIVTGSSPLGNTCLSHAASSVEHGMALTHILHHVMTTTDLLTGLHEAFQWQWTGALTLAGYLFAYPTSSNATAVREAIDLSIVVFEQFGRCFGTSLGAAMVMRDLAIKADFLADLVRNSNPASSTMIPNTPDNYTTSGTTEIAHAPPPPPPQPQQQQQQPLPQQTNEMAFSQQDLFGGPMDIVYAIDTSGDLETLWPTMGASEQMWFHAPKVESLKGVMGQM